MEQATLTEFYSTKKRPIEGIHPSKRRKVIQSDSVMVSSEQAFQEDVRVVPRRMKTRTNAKPVQRSTRKTRAKTIVKNTQSSCLQDFVSKGTIDLKNTDKIAVEVTSVVDDHVSAVAPQDEETSTRRRKTRQKAKEPSPKPAKSQDESSQEKQNIVLKACSTKRSQSTTNSEKETRVKPHVESNTLDNAKVKSNTNEQGFDKRDMSESLQAENKSPVRSSSSGLKINPWIADQANKVLLSRGHAALLLSQQNRTTAKETHSSKVKNQKSKEAPNSTLSKTKAQEGLEKARELIKKMRSLESDASKAKETSTTDKTERLHKLAKRQSVDASAPAEHLASKPKKPPAHERYHSLAQPSETTVRLPLPYKYKVLGELFTSCDTILNLLGQRNETCTFEKLKEAVQQMSRKRFEKKHLAQMLVVLPNSYDLQQVRCNPKSASYQLTIQFAPTKNSKDCRLTVSSTELLSRKKLFQDKLLATTKAHHQTFLKSLEVPLTVDDDKIIRWHPQFKLDEVPDIEQTALPEAPVIKTYTSAQDVLDKGLAFMAPKVEKALKNVAQNSKEKPKDITYDSQPKGEDNQAKNKNVKTNIALKGVSQDLLNKIRQKEAKKLEEKMMRDPVVDKKIIMQERLPDLCRILKTYFTAEKKAAIPLEDAAIKLSESYKSSLTPGQVEEHLRLLSELVPEWFSMLLVRKCPYVKINRKADINTVIKTVSQKEIK